MKILHLTADYHSSKIYKKLINKLDEKEVEQIVYVALKNIKNKNKNKIKESKNIEYVYSAPFKRIDSYLYYSKIYKIYKDIINKIKINEVNIVHAHFLFSDGGVAYQLYEKHNIEYVVAIRNSDLNIFFKYGLHVRSYGRKILKNAKKIILISESYRKQVLNNYIPQKYRDEINQKMVTIPNGINDYWFKNSPKGIRNHIIKTGEIKLIYVGNLNKNKNIKTILKVMKLIEQKKIKVDLKIVGEGELKDKLMLLAKQMKLNVQFYGYIKSIKAIKNLYKESDIFIMPSKRETFGLVYIEAMSQGLPVIYTKNQGIDGFFPEGSVGYASNPFETKQIKENIFKIINNYEIQSYRAVQESQKFNWDYITDQYLNLYNDVINKFDIDKKSIKKS